MVHCMTSHVCFDAGAIGAWIVARSASDSRSTSACQGRSRCATWRGSRPASGWRTRGTFLKWNAGLVGELVRPDGPDRGRRCRGMGGVKIVESRPFRLRGGLHRLSRGLIAYGIVGLIVTATSFGALVWANSRISDLRAEAEATVARLATTMEVAAYVLHGASTTAQSFSATVDQSAQAVSAAA